MSVRVPSDSKKTRIEEVAAIGLRKAALQRAAVSAPGTAPGLGGERVRPTERPPLDDDTIRSALDVLWFRLHSPSVADYERAATHPIFGHINSWNTRGVFDMNSLFATKRWSISFREAGIDLKMWETGGVVSMESMFMNCKAFESDLSGWNVENVVTTKSMFEGCSLFNSDLSEWRVGKVKTMKRMFYDASTFRADISKWDVSNVQYFHGMLKGSDVPTNTDLSKWSLHPTFDMTQMGISELFGLFNPVRGWGAKYPVGFLSYNANFPVELWPNNPVTVAGFPKGNVLRVTDDKNGTSCFLRPPSDAVFSAFQILMNAIDPDDFDRRAADKKDMGPFFRQNYNHLKVRAVYKVFNFKLQEVYKSRREGVKSQMQSDFCKRNFKKVQCTRTDKIVKQFDYREDQFDDQFDEDISEKLLLHGTSADATFSICANGFRIPSKSGAATGAAYGNGIYFAEDAKKSDQYAVSGRHALKGVGERSYFPNQLEQHFAKTLNTTLKTPLEDTLYYMLASRVVLGCAAHVEGGKFGGNRVKDLETKELAHSATKESRFHSVIVEHGDKEADTRANASKSNLKRGAHYREFVVPDTELALPEFVVAYERVVSDGSERTNYADLDC